MSSQKTSDPQYGKHWCRYCKIYVHNSPLAIKRHEEAGRHKHNVREHHKSHQREKKFLERAERESFREIQRIGASVGLNLESNQPVNSAPRRSARPPPPREPKPDQGPAVSWAHGSDAAAAAAAVATTNDDNEDGGQLTDETFYVPPGQAAPELGEWETVEADDKASQMNNAGDADVDDGDELGGRPGVSKRNAAATESALDEEAFADDVDAAAAAGEGILAPENTKEMSLAMRESLANAASGSTTFKKRKRKAGAMSRKKLTQE